MEEKKVNLDGIMYDEEGNFIPLTASHGNISGELAHLRNTYMEAERKYFEHLLSFSNIYNAFMAYVDCYESDELFAEAVKIRDQLENGELETAKDLEKMKNMTPSEREIFHLNKLEYAETMMCLLFAAARDKALILELVRTPGGRSR